MPPSRSEPCTEQPLARRTDSRRVTCPGSEYRRDDLAVPGRRRTTGSFRDTRSKVGRRFIIRDFSPLLKTVSEQLYGTIRFRYPIGAFSKGKWVTSRWGELSISDRRARSVGSRSRQPVRPRASERSRLRGTRPFALELPRRTRQGDDPSWCHPPPPLTRAGMRPRRNIASSSPRR